MFLSKQISIRKASRLDAHQVAAIFKESSNDGLVARSDEVHPTRVSTQIEAARASGNSLFLVATIPVFDKNDPSEVIDDEVLGVLSLEGGALMRLNDVARITMAVAIRARRHQLATRLLTEALRWADASKKIRKIELLVRATNQPAIAFFTRHGFAEEGRLRARLRLDDGTFVDDVCMARFRP